jgi:hypothetical protein
MIPVRTRGSNFIYRGNGHDVEDVWVERPYSGVAILTWKPSDEERAAIAAGANIDLVIGTEPIPPTDLHVSTRTERSASAGAIRDRRGRPLGRQDRQGDRRQRQGLVERERGRVR